MIFLIVFPVIVVLVMSVLGVYRSAEEKAREKEKKQGLNKAVKTPQTARQ